MSKGTFTYCLLQYHHSQILGEVMNIGLVVYFPQSNKLEFIYPEKILRLRFAYPDVPEKTIKAYYKHFEQRVADLNNSPEIFARYSLDKSLQHFVNAELLPPDSSALQFGNYRTSVFYTTNTEQITNQLYNLYFSVFQVQENEVKRIDENVLLNKYKKLLREYTLNELRESSKLKFDYSIEPQNASKIVFDVAWKDEGETHLVKPVSFDLKRQDTISRKAYQFYGQFTALEELAETNHYLFDVILARPKNKALFKSYDNAITLLEKPKRVKLVEFKELDSYSKATVESTLL